MKPSWKSALKSHLHWKTTIVMFRGEILKMLWTCLWRLASVSGISVSMNWPTSTFIMTVASRLVRLHILNEALHKQLIIFYTNDTIMHICHIRSWWWRPLRVGRLPVSCLGSGLLTVMADCVCASIRRRLFLYARRRRNDPLCFPGTAVLLTHSN